MAGIENKMFSIRAVAQIENKQLFSIRAPYCIKKIEKRRIHKNTVKIAVNCFLRMFIALTLKYRTFNETSNKTERDAKNMTCQRLKHL